jgi:hypothetical protein
MKESENHSVDYIAAKFAVSAPNVGLNSSTTTKKDRELDVSRSRWRARNGIDLAIPVPCSFARQNS